jgi:hypothetical protein
VPPILKSERQDITQMMTALRADVFRHIQGTVLKYLAPTAKTMKTAGLGNYPCVFEPEDLPTYSLKSAGSKTGRGTAQSDTELREGIRQIRDSIEQIPTTVSFFEDQLPICGIPRNASYKQYSKCFVPRCTGRPCSAAIPSPCCKQVKKLSQIHQTFVCWSAA